MFLVLNSTSHTTSIPSLTTVVVGLGNKVEIVTCLQEGTGKLLQSQIFNPC